MRVRAQDVPMQSPEDLNTVLNMTVDDALSLALQKTENQTLDPGWYEGILAKLGEVERDAFTLGLASKGVRVEAQLKDDVIVKLEDIVKARGFIYESEYRDACWNQSGEIVGAVNAWIMNSMIPLKRNPPKGDISEQYKKRVKKNLNNPNVLNMKASQKTAALRDSDKRVIEAFIDKTEDASPRLETDGTVLSTMGFIGSGIVASWQNDKIVFEHDAFSRFEQSIFDYIEKATPKAYLTKRGQATDFAMEQSELERAILAWQPKLPNIKEWLDKVRKSKTIADIQRIWNQLWHTKEETDPMVKKTQPYRETVELEEGPALELAHLQKAKKLLAADFSAAAPWEGTQAEELERVLSAVITLDGKGAITLEPDKDPAVYVALVHDGAYGTPGAVICVILAKGNQPRPVMEAAHKILTQKAMENKEYVRELQEEYGDRWEKMLTETFVGTVFTLPASEAARIISKDEWAKKYITINRGPSVQGKYFEKVQADKEVPHSELVEITPTDLADLARKGSKKMAADQSIVDAIARTFFVDAWASQEEEAGRTYPGEDLMKIAPDVPPEAYDAALQLVDKIEAKNDRPLVAPEGADPELFGFYIAMEALGHGVAWTDDHEPHGYKIPYTEFYWYPAEESEGFEEEAAKSDVQTLVEYLATLRDVGEQKDVRVDVVMSDLGWNDERMLSAIEKADLEITPDKGRGRVKLAATVVDEKKKYIKLAAYVKWDQVDHDLYIGTVSKNDIDFRVDGREKGYRVDMRTIGPWEAIDDGVPFDTEKEAKAWAGTYYALVLEQGTVHPKKPKRHAAVVPHEGPDWEITKIDESTRSTYRIEGNNLNRSPDDMDYRFHWEVDSVGDPRYFASPNIEITPAAQKILDRRGETIGGGDWRKERSAKVADRNFSSDSPNQFERYLAGVVVLDGDGTLYLDEDPQVHIAIVHDSTGFQPGAAIYVAEEHESADRALEKAWEILEFKAMEDTKYVKELQAEWGDEWNEILTETFDGMVFTLSASVAAKIISKDRFASKYITIEKEGGEENA